MIEEEFERLIIKAREEDKRNKRKIIIGIAVTSVVLLFIFGVKMTNNNKKQKEREHIARIEVERRQQAVRERMAHEEERRQQVSENIDRSGTDTRSYTHEHESEYAGQIRDLSAQLSIAQSFREHLINNDNITSWLPYSGLNNSTIEKYIFDYNILLMEREELIANSSENNPAVAQKNDKLQSMRKSISEVVDNQIINLNMQLSGLKSQEARMTQQLQVSRITNLETVIPKRLLTENDLRGLSKEQLRILRNTIFARHGRKFVSKDLQEYFGAKEWYRPRYDEVTHLMNSYEIKNVEIIQKYE